MKGRFCNGNGLFFCLTQALSKEAGEVVTIVVILSKGEA